MEAFNCHYSFSILLDEVKGPSRQPILSNTKSKANPRPRYQKPKQDQGIWNVLRGCLEANHQGQILQYITANYCHDYIKYLLQFLFCFQLLTESFEDNGGSGVIGMDDSQSTCSYSSSRLGSEYYNGKSSSGGRRGLHAQHAIGSTASQILPVGFLWLNYELTEWVYNLSFLLFAPLDNNL